MKQYAASLLFSGVFVFACFSAYGDGVSPEEAREKFIKPATIIEVGPAKKRTQEEIIQGEIALAPLPAEGVMIPFMPTMDPSEYAAEKAAAGQRADEAPSPELEPQVPPEPQAPPKLKGINFDGINQKASGVFPPDTHGAVGPLHFVEVVNAQAVVFDRRGVQLSRFSLGALFGTTDPVFDPRVVFDQTWNRWVIVATRMSESPTDVVQRFFLAITQTPDPTGDYFVYFISFFNGPFDEGDWWDFPQLGMNQDALIITGNIFDAPSGDFKGAAMMPVAKARVYNGLDFSAPIFANLDGTLAPPIVLDQNKDAYLVAASNFTHLTLYRGENLSSAFEATLVLQSQINVPDYAIPPDALQLDTFQKLDTSDRRFVNASTQIGDSLWNVHTINFNRFARPKFYEIDTEDPGANTIKQQGFFSESRTSYDFNASIAANELGEVFVTWSTTDVRNSNVNLRHNARIRFSGRQASDPLGVIPRGSVLFTSTMALTGNTGAILGVQRWGDYSAVSLDPLAISSDNGKNRHAWIVNEKIDTPDTWGSRIGRIGFRNE
ncbi:MAG: hypothetical protein E3K32_00270 [wastewater metagenome]|nr:hypothetical protein [Candidatus Loosdrechtia aerotolerans]